MARGHRGLPRTLRGRRAALAVLAVAGLGIARLLAPAPPAGVEAADAPPPAPVEAPPPDVPVAATGPRAPVPEPAGAPPGPRGGALRASVDQATLARWEARVAREQAAQARFERGLEESQVRARDIDARVREALRRAELVPELLDGGHMTGLRIRSLEPGSALAETGLREGDLLVRIGEDRLDDPARLPRALADAGPDLTLCVRRGGRELCRDLALR